MPSDAAAELKSRLRSDLKEALLGRRPAEVRLLRMLVSALDNAEAPPLADPGAGYVRRAFGDASVEVQRQRLEAADVHAVLQRERAERTASAGTLTAVGRTAEAEAVLDEIRMIGRYLSEAD